MSELDKQLAVIVVLAILFGAVALIARLSTYHAETKRIHDHAKVVEAVSQRPSIGNSRATKHNGNIMLGYTAEVTKSAEDCVFIGYNNWKDGRHE